MDAKSGETSGGSAPRIPTNLLMGFVAVVVAAAHLIALRGAEPRFILLFGLPLLIAVKNLRPIATVGERIVAATFLALLAIGAVVSRDQTFFPKLGGIAKNGLALQHDRMLSWYLGTYLVFLLAVVPWFMFGRALKRHRNGEQASFSLATCYLGLVVSVLMTIGLPQALARQGFWPLR